MASDRMFATLGVEDLTVIRNLETAFEEETKASTAYKAYAARADEEGYPGLASLFRATALAEQIHAGNHARVLRHLGGSPTIDAPKPRIESSFENLKSALVIRSLKWIISIPLFLLPPFRCLTQRRSAVFTGLWRRTSRMCGFMTTSWRICRRVAVQAGSVRNMRSSSAVYADTPPSILMAITVLDAITCGENLKR